MQKTENLIQDKMQSSYHAVDLFHYRSDGSVNCARDEVINEQPVTLMIDKVGSFTVMSTPVDIKALAIGFIFTEGLIDGIEDVIVSYTKPELPNVIGIEVYDPTKIKIGRNLIIASSCGMCGTRNIERMFKNIKACDDTFEISNQRIINIMQQMRGFQHLFEITGGSHGAAIFNNDGKIVAVAEDIGRHNALDKVIGKCLMAGFKTRGCGLALSGRVSLEIVTKAARAGIELIAAVSAVSSYAVSAAERWNITLCGFARADKMNVYTKHERIINDSE